MLASIKWKVAEISLVLFAQGVVKVLTDFFRGSSGFQIEVTPCGSLGLFWSIAKIRHDLINILARRKNQK